jgi:putative DNA primase/helicase
MDVEDILSRLHGVRRNGASAMARCPAHHDREPSLSVKQGDDGRVLLHCFAGCPAEAVVEAMGLSLSDLFPTDSAHRKRQRRSTEPPIRTTDGCTLADYCVAKGFDPATIRGFGVTETVRGKPGAPALRIPHFDEHGVEISVLYRERLHKPAPPSRDARFKWRAGDKWVPYGLDRLADAIARDGFVLLVEGVSDCHACWSQDPPLPALGMPGCDWKPAWDHYLDGAATVVIAIEPDAGGTNVMKWLPRMAWRDRARLLHLVGAKDLADLRVDDPLEFGMKALVAVQAAVPLAPEELEPLDAEVVVPDAPIVPGDPMPAARAFVDAHFAHGAASRLRRWRGTWLRWEVVKWCEVEADAVKAAAYAYTESAYSEVPGKGYRPWAPNRKKVADLLDAVAAVVALGEGAQPPVWLAPPPSVVGDAVVSVANGLLDVGSRTLLPHDLAYFNQIAVPFAYDPAATAPGWLRFLDDLWPDDPESIAALQEFAGYIISGRIDLHKILLLIGPTRAGKGVIGRVLKALVGRENAAGPTLASLGTNFGLSPLIDKPLAIISDARLGGANIFQVVERLLSVSGEDMLTVDRKYKAPWTGTLPTRFVVLTNELPRFGDASGAIANRFIVLSLTASWLGRENPALTAQLLPELPGILNWALDGLARLAAQGRFTEPKTSRDAIVALRDLASPVGAFVRERCERGAHAVACRVLYDAWKVWADDNGHRPGSLQVFSRNLHAVVPELKAGRPWGSGDSADRPRTFQGVRLRSTDYNGADRGLPRTGTGRTGAGVVLDSPRSDPLYLPLDGLEKTDDRCSHCGQPAPLLAHRGSNGERWCGECWARHVR